ncbi:DUF4238 domain-containing protein [Brevundimonas viscosa]|uniref:DUF4238 domain-containing protein n=1 Tax=Brevundimonas viscosa TaxID=871741 RepID=A0A1I6T7R0_9CAUL|nr:DUF4238 domain-containing protein [Brevundimonas viscosa]SFS85281.1 Protein of unknown function [Brevundimonas viscosa]
MSTRSHRHNHYVPEWYQKRFLPAGQHRLHYLDLRPDRVESDGHIHTRRALNFWGPRRCFAQDDLYTTYGTDGENTDVERFFFGNLDRTAPSSVEFFANFDHRTIEEGAFETFLRNMSVQKLRTPRGIAWLRSVIGTPDRNALLQELQRLQNLFCATWTNCVWQIADAGSSPTRFILSDNPVTIYNRDCFPGARECRFPNDPDVRLAGTQTIFPLSSQKVLLLTNLTWARNPYQSATRLGPNRRLMRDAMFHFGDIQIGRQLSEEEVVEINFIIKKRADRYVAAADPEWLYPERAIRCDHWRKLGDGYLLMPDPRHVHMGGTMWATYTSGETVSYNEYGHRPWEREFENTKREQVEREALLRFQAEWAALHGPYYRGFTSHFRDRMDQPVTDEYHRHLVRLDELTRLRNGERQRRRRLMRG